MPAFTRATLVALALTLAACGPYKPNFGDPNAKPDYIKGTIATTSYDGSTNDLLTRALGKTGLAGAAPAPANPPAPTLAEVRTIAIHNNDLAANMVNALQGTRTAAATAGTTSQFTAALSATDLAAYNTAFPNRWAFKHAHSQQNSEATWGRDTLRAIEFAFYMLNQKYGETHDGIVYQSDKLTSAKTIVIASSVSNGAGAAVAALEQDTNGLIDGIAVGEPQIFMNPPAGLTIKRGSTAVSSFGKTLYDYFTLATLYEPCAAISTAAAGANSAGLALAAVRPDPTIAAPPCAVLASKGLGSGSTTQAPADDA